MDAVDIKTDVVDVKTNAKEDDPVIVAKDVKNETFLNRNIRSFLSLIVIVASFAFFVFVIRLNGLSAGNQEGKDLIIFVLGVITSQFGNIIGYYFGSSSGSDSKSKTLEKMIGK